MTTIADKLLLLANTKSEIEEAIEAKGVDVPAGLPFSSYPAKIAEIQSGVSGNPDPSAYCPITGTLNKQTLTRLMNIQPTCRHR